MRIHIDKVQKAHCLLYLLLFILLLKLFDFNLIIWLILPILSIVNYTQINTIYSINHSLSLIILLILCEDFHSGKSQALINLLSSLHCTPFLGNLLPVVSCFWWLSSTRWWYLSLYHPWTSLLGKLNHFINVFLNNKTANLNASRLLLLTSKLSWARKLLIPPPKMNFTPNSFYSNHYFH